MAKEELAIAQRERELDRREKLLQQRERLVALARPDAAPRSDGEVPGVDFWAGVQPAVCTFGNAIYRISPVRDVVTAGAKIYRKSRYSSGDALPLTPLNGPVSGEAYRLRHLPSPYYQGRSDPRS